MIYTVMPPSRPPLVCLYEDRPQQVAGVKVLLLSLNRYCPTWPVRLRFPGISDSFRAWLQQFKQVALFEERLPSSGSYNVKPTVLLDGLSSGAEACLWLDTDVLVNGDLGFIASLPAESIAVTQDPWEYADGSTHRCETWGMITGRSLPGPFNSAVVRVTRVHEPLLHEWERVLATQAYLAEQAKPVVLRNQHMLSDQDALSALLASRQFASTPLRKLMHCTEILQHHGAGAYGLAQRWSNISHGMPPLIHAMGSVKPWRMPEHPSLLRDPRSYYERTYLELSPYVHFARSYKAALMESSAWLENRTLASRFGSLASLNRPWLKGSVQGVLHRAWYFSGLRSWTKPIAGPPASRSLS
jgi:hypothetical protein